MRYSSFLILVFYHPLWDNNGLKVNVWWTNVLRLCITIYLNDICHKSPFLAVSLQIYYELDEQRKKVQGKDVAICRVEQLCPFPYDLIQRELKRYPSTSSKPAYI